jgi:DNA-directed RNA polymerase subunit RPC12/RpoP
MKKLYCSTCKKYVEEAAYDFISGTCRRCLAREMKKGRHAVVEDVEEIEEEEDVEEEEDGE